jgi:hypothetical protein
MWATADVALNTPEEKQDVALTPMQRAPWIALSCKASSVQQARPASKAAVVTPANGKARKANSIAAVPATFDQNFLDRDLFMASAPFLVPSCFVSKQSRGASHLHSI